MVAHKRPARHLGIFSLMLANDSALTYLGE